MVELRSKLVGSAGQGWVHRLALGSAGLTLLLLIAGGLVTSLDVGLAVPDWPTSFGQPMLAFAWRAAPMGVQVEHIHRLLGALVGLATVVMALGVLVAERRRVVCWLSVAAVVAVLVQGVLGGLRVKWNALAGQELAILHGAVAHAFFALLVVLTVLTSGKWQRAPVVARAETRWLQATAGLLAGLVYLQIVLGAILRHLGNVGGVFVGHLVGAAAVVGLAMWLALVIGLDPGLRPFLGRSAFWAVGLAGLQVFLGLGAMLATNLVPPGLASAPTTTETVATILHVVCGALLFGFAGAVALGTFGYLEAPRTAATGTSTARHAAAVLEPAR